MKFVRILYKPVNKLKSFIVRLFTGRLPVLRNSSDLNIRNRRFSSLLLRQNRSKPVRFFVVLIGFRRCFNLRIVRFCHSKNLTNRTVPTRIRTLDPYITSHLLLHCTTCPFVLPYIFCIENKLRLSIPTKNDDNRHFLLPKPTIPTKTTLIDTSYIKYRQYRRKRE